MSAIPSRSSSALVVLACALGGCAGEVTSGLFPDTAPEETGGHAGAGGGGAGGGNAGEGGAAGVAETGGSGGTAPLALDPGEAGPWQLSVYEAKVENSRTGNDYGVKCWMPATPGPAPLVLLAHGFKLEPSQYEGTATHVAAFGFVVCNVDYPAGLTGVDHAKNAADLSGAIDWALSESHRDGSPLNDRIDGHAIGLLGHSLGGKVSVLAALKDPRVDAVVGLDPVDTAMMCDPAKCPDATNAMPLAIPTVFLGETTDATALIPGSPACAPEADNFRTFFEAANKPSVEVEVLGANHMSFLDTTQGCLSCSACRTATAAQGDVLELSRSFAVAGFGRHLQGIADYDRYLTGEMAKQRYVKTGRAAIRRK